jgi:hypothetical protein
MVMSDGDGIVLLMKDQHRMKGTSHLYLLLLNVLWDDRSTITTFPPLTSTHYIFSNFIAFPVIHSQLIIIKNAFTSMA